MLNRSSQTVEQEQPRGASPQMFSQLMHTHMERVYWHIRRLVVSHADAQDATQETFVRVFKGLPKFKGESHVQTWIFRIATNEALRVLEKRRNNMLPIDDPQANIKLLQADDYVDLSQAEAVKLQTALLQLPAKQQLAFNLRYYDDMSYSEIARITGSTVANVKVNYHIAKEKIRKFFNENE